MRNYALKFEILLRRFQEDASSHEFLDLPLPQAYEAFKAKLPERVRECLFFTFSDKALLDVLDQEFDLHMERPTLVFRKTTLDAESLRLAANVQKTFSPQDERFMEDLAKWLLEMTRSLFREDLSTEKTRQIEEEYQQALRIYADKYGDTEAYSLQTLFVRRNLITHFTHAMTSDAIFKVDAVKALLGENSAYYQAWQRKELFRHRITQAVEGNLFRRAASGGLNA